MPARRPSRRAALLLVAAVEVLAMGTWFSASAVQPALQAHWEISDSQVSWLTGAVQLGFVAGSLISATLNLADRFECRRLIAASAGVAAAANLGLLAAGSAEAAILCRLATGACLAGVYPPGMKLIAGYFPRRLGFAIGVLIAALTLGSGSPHLVQALPDVSWRGVIVVTSLGGVLAAGLIRIVPDGPSSTSASRIDPRFVLRAARLAPLRLATFGYLGHMWELYAFWAWVPSFLTAASALSPTGLSLSSFAVIGISGALGAAIAGPLGDRYGRGAVSCGALAISGGCCLLSPVAFAWSLPALLVFLGVWGIAVIADSGQLSAAIAELAPKELVGSALTLQTAVGFLLTVLSIRLIPELATLFGWRYALAVLAFGPLFGIVSMLRLLRRPEAVSLARGQRGATGRLG